MSPRAGRRDRAAATADHRPEGDRGRSGRGRPRRTPADGRRPHRRPVVRAARAHGCRRTSRISPGRWSRPAPAAWCSPWRCWHWPACFRAATKAWWPSTRGSRASNSSCATSPPSRRWSRATPRRWTISPGVLRAWKPSIATPRPPVADPALANRIATLEGDLKALGERVGVLGRRNDEIASIAGEARTRADAAAAAVAELKKTPAPAAPAVEPRGDRSAHQPHRRARARRQGDGGAAWRAREPRRAAPIVRCGSWWSRARSMRRSSAARRSPPSSAPRRPPRPIRKCWRRSSRSRRRACRARLRWRASSRR